MTDGSHRVRLHAPPSAAQARPGDGETAVLVEAARREGREEGLRSALESGAGQLEALLHKVDEAAERSQEELARTAVELAVEIAAALVGTRIEAGDYDLERIVRAALADADLGRGACVVHLSPADEERLQGVLFRAGTRLEVDAHLPAGVVHLTTPRGLLVRDPEAALDSIREQLLEEVAE